MQSHSVYFIFLCFSWTTAEGASITKNGCPSKCGELRVPYPFGVGINSGCSLNPFFAINCDASFNPPKAFLGTYKFEVLNISETKISIKNSPAVQCFDQYGRQNKSIEFFMNLSSSPFTLSNENKLTVVGCDDAALLSSVDGEGDEEPDDISSCAAICSKPDDLSNGFCSGIGCSQSSIPKGLQSFYIQMDTSNYHSHIWNFSSCGYSFLGEESSYSFNTSDVSNSSFVSRIEETVPIAIEWTIGNNTCEQLVFTDEIICQQNSVCVDSGSTLGVGGYHCNCSRGYRGNPYLSPGCQDINECNDSNDIKPCHQDATCSNIQGSFNCSCPLNYIGDGTKHGTGCIYVPLPSRKAAIYAGLVTGSVLFLTLVVSFWLCKLMKKRRIEQVKQNLFKRNGGLLLQQQMSAQDCVLEKMRIFASKELEKATDKFNRSRILGRGGQGTVYKGMLSDGRTIAVKKSKHENENQLKEFINEFVILSQVNHRNVVKLLGCCLETEIPLLVYEFIPNRTLYHLIHDHDTIIPFSWEVRLRIATEIGNALAYLHYEASIPIYHRDMKSTNILLDEKYRAKLSDFGISKSLRIDQTHLTTKVKGTFGYLDPEYFQTGQFTEKSDVYSFGVVLVELLTGQKPIVEEEEEEEVEDRSLVSRFLLAMEDNQLGRILDSRIKEAVTEEHIEVSNLAKRCLNIIGKKRPTVREVVMELESIRSCENPSPLESYIQDISCTDSGSFVHEDIDDSRTQSGEFMVDNSS